MTIARRRHHALGLIAASLLFSSAAAAADKIPLVAVGPKWSLHLPFQIVGLGAGTNVHLPHLLNVSANFQYGIATEKDQDDKIAGWLAEIYVGYPIDFSGTHSGSHADSQSTSSTSTTTTTTTYYHDESYSSGESLVLEAGVFTGPALVFFYDPTDWISPKRIGRGQMLYPQAGIRYIVAWDKGDDRNMNAFWLHAIGPGIGLPKANGTEVGYSPSALGSKPDSNFSGVSGKKSSETRPVGVAIGMSAMMWANAFGSLDVELAYLPAGGTWGLMFGNTIPFWF